MSINKTNLAPDRITVYISGNVANPGSHVLDQGSSLIQAIYKAGGEKYFTGMVKHLRFNETGKTERNIFKYDPTASLKSQKNPILLNGDIIRVNQTIIGKAQSAIKEISTPIITSVGVFNLLED